MPVIVPGEPECNAGQHVVAATLRVMQREFVRGSVIMQRFSSCYYQHQEDDHHQQQQQQERQQSISPAGCSLSPAAIFFDAENNSCNWEELFEEVQLRSRYRHLIRLEVSCTSQSDHDYAHANSCTSTAAAETSTGVPSPALLAALSASLPAGVRGRDKDAMLAWSSGFQSFNDLCSARLHILVAQLDLLAEVEAVHPMTGWKEVETRGIHTSQTHQRKKKATFWIAVELNEDCGGLVQGGRQSQSAGALAPVVSYFMAMHLQSHLNQRRQSQSQSGSRRTKELIEVDATTLTMGASILAKCPNLAVLEEMAMQEEEAQYQHLQQHWHPHQHQQSRQPPQQQHKQHQARHQSHQHQHRFHRSKDTHGQRQMFRRKTTNDGVNNSWSQSQSRREGALYNAGKLSRDLFTGR
jgi:poly(A) polymerase Pap1